MDSVAAFKCDGYGFKSLLAGYLGKDSVHWGYNFYLFIIETDRSKTTKSQFLFVIKVHQSQMLDNKIASKGKMLLSLYIKKVRTLRMF